MRCSQPASQAAGYNVVDLAYASRYVHRRRTLSACACVPVTLRCAATGQKAKRRSSSGCRGGCGTCQWDQALLVLPAARKRRRLAGGDGLASVHMHIDASHVTPRCVAGLSHPHAHGGGCSALHPPGHMRAAAGRRSEENAMPLYSYSFSFSSRYPLHDWLIGVWVRWIWA